MHPRNVYLEGGFEGAVQVEPRLAVREGDALPELGLPGQEIEPGWFSTEQYNTSAGLPAADPGHAHQLGGGEEGEAAHQQLVRQPVQLQRNYQHNLLFVVIKLYSNFSWVIIVISPTWFGLCLMPGLARSEGGLLSLATGTSGMARTFHRSELELEVSTLEREALQSVMLRGRGCGRAGRGNAGWGRGMLDMFRMPSTPPGVNRQASFGR